MDDRQSIDTALQAGWAAAWEAYETARDYGADEATWRAAFGAVEAMRAAMLAHHESDPSPAYTYTT